MGVNDAREQLEVAKAEYAKLEAEFEEVCAEVEHYAAIAEQNYDKAARLARLHEVATERTVQLAAVIEKAYEIVSDEDNWEFGSVFYGGGALEHLLAKADPDAALREVRAKAWEEGALQGAEDNENGVEVMSNPYREGSDG